MGGMRIFHKTFVPLSLMITYQMSIISAESKSLDSTFKVFQMNPKISSKKILRAYVGIRNVYV